MLKKLKNNLIDMVFPPKCISCTAYVEDNGVLCPTCWGDISFIADPACEICHFPFEYKVEGISVCASCMVEKPVFNKARSAFIYNDKSKKLVTGFKYSDKTHATSPFANMLYRAGNDIIQESDFIVPVPMHRIRLFKRRYNQSAMLSHALSKKCALPVVTDMLIKHKNTPPQASLNRKERLANVKGTLTFNSKYKDAVGKTVLLIDDVMTTGATVHESTKTLLRSGIAKVNVLTLARIVER